ncbi:Myo15.2 family protein [Megaselia abdita]
MALDDVNGNQNDLNSAFELCESEEGVAINYLKSFENLMKEYSDLQSEESNNVITAQNFNLNFNILDYQKIKGFNVHNRMETILEEPLATKLTVKEILAKFETLKETDTLSSKPSDDKIPFICCNNNKEPIEEENLDIQNNSTSNMLHCIHKKNNENDTENDNEDGEGRGSEAEVDDEEEDEKEEEIEEIPRHHESPSSDMEISSSKEDEPHILIDVEISEKCSVSTMSSNADINQLPLYKFLTSHYQDKIKMNTFDSHQFLRDLIRWQGKYLQEPLLNIPKEYAYFAIECFDCILKYCGDIPMHHSTCEVKCVYTILMYCHKYFPLRDEVYCQLIKQTTENESLCPDSLQRAWRLLSILAAYFACSESLQSYIIEHFNSIASDSRKICHGIAAACLSNLRKTARCGGRKNVPSVEEVTAVSAGRSARRQIYRLPGGSEKVVNTKCSTVVKDVICELCSLLGIDEKKEQSEFSLYCIVEGDAMTMPLAFDEYILDVTTEFLKSNQPFYLIFCRSIWFYPLKVKPTPRPLYVEVLFNQVMPDYLEGLLLEIPKTGIPTAKCIQDIAELAVILHRAANLRHPPNMKEVKFLLPKTALYIREIRPRQWLEYVHKAWGSIVHLSPITVKLQFLVILSKWSLFGSSFFAVKRMWNHYIADEETLFWREMILVLNQEGISFLEPNTHQTIQKWHFSEIISTRKVRSEEGVLFLDLKVGNLVHDKIIRIQTEQAHEISRLTRQYITLRKEI